VTRATVALIAGLALVAIAIGVTLSGRPVVVARTNSTLANGSLAETTSAASACQAGETLPADISAIRLTLRSEIGPRVSLRALSGTRVLTSGAVGNGWTGGSVTVPVRPLPRTSPHVRVCFAVDASRESVGIVGSPTNSAVAARSHGKALPGRIKIEYLREGPSSWWSMAPQVARRLGLGHAPSGTWLVLPLIALMGAVVAGGSWLAVRELR
jgi:hypothetical protein